MTSTCRIIQLPESRRERRRWRRYVLLAVAPQYLSLAVLVLYGVLRLLTAPHVPFSHYVGPLVLLWPVAFLLLLISYVADWLLWEW